MAIIAIEGNKEDSSSTIATNITHIDIKLNGATQVVGFVVTGNLFNIFSLFYPSTIVKANLDLISFSA